MAVPILCVGSVALDTIHTPTASVQDVLGGSATHFAFAACHFASVTVVGVVGHDFPDAHRQRFAARAIALDGLDERPAPSFRWEARYGAGWNERETLRRELEIQKGWAPQVPDAHRGAQYVFLATDPPAVQMAALDQLHGPAFVMVDTMDYFIVNHREALLALLARVHAVCVNEQEAFLLAGAGARGLLARAAAIIAEMGPDVVIIKKGSHGAVVYRDGELFLLSALLLDAVVDPTGAGDSFSGALLGQLARGEALDNHSLRTAAAYGTAAASICCEHFSVDGLERAGLQDLDDRVRTLRQVTQFGH